MPEGLSPSEVGKELAEHRHRLEEEEKERGEGSATEVKGRERWLTITEAILLAVVAVLAAWSGFASAKWSTHSSLELAKANADSYVRTTVYLATVLFLVGISGHFKVRAARMGLISLGGVILVFSSISLILAPKPPV